MKVINYWTVVVAMLMVLGLTAQDLKPKEHVELGQELMDRGAYLEAADHFKSAWEEKPNKEEWIFMAGEAYEKAMDYEQAAAAFEQILDEKDYPDVKLRLASLLKQSGDYTRANKLFLDYLYDYEEDDKREVEHRVNAQIRGCELGIQLLQAGNSTGIRIAPLSDAVNSPGHETNPIPFDETVLYYNSDITGSSKFYRSEKRDGAWSKGMVPPLFPDMENLSVGNGAFSPDFERFYFNQCEEQGNGLTGDRNCALYYIVREQGSWSSPIRMKDYINISGTSNAHPYVVYLDQKEIIYFSSDRSGGHGGKDLWYIVRDLTSDISEYTFPTNLGKNINSPGDEIAPFYSPDEGNLYFSSNGRVSMGGFDVFRSRGSEAFWEIAENAGLPFNSAAEDFQYRTSRDGTKGYIVSNRKYDGEINTTDFDIFSFENSMSSKDVVLTGRVFDESQEKVVSGATVRLLRKEGSEYLLSKKLEAIDGSYRFILKPKSTYKLLAEKDGYLSTEMTIDASSIASSVALEQDMIIVSGVASSTKSPGQKSTDNVVDTVRNSISKELPVSKKTTVPGQEQLSDTQQINGNTPAPARAATKSEKDIQAVDNKTVKITKPRQSDTDKRDTATQAIKREGRIVDAQPVDKKRAIIKRDTNAEIPQANQENASLRTVQGAVLSGIYYKVQICSVGDFDPNNSAFDQVRYLGNLDTEFLPEKNMTRVLLGSFESRTDAENVSQNARRSGFPGAFIVQYKDGQRLNR
jgi:hypothetical protein